MTRREWVYGLRAVSAVLVAFFATLITLSALAWLGQIREPPEPRVRGRKAPIELALPPPPSPELPEPEDVTPELFGPAPSQSEAPAPPKVSPSALANIGPGTFEGPGMSLLPALGSGFPDGLPSAGAVGAKVAEKPRAAGVAARALSQPPPRYPPDARRRRLEGYVTVRIRITASGRVEDVVVVDADPPGVFDTVAKEAARRYRFQPAREDGEAVASTVEQRIVFRLKR